MAPTDNADERTHRIQESADKIRVKTAIKRGNGTRDEDRITVKVKGDSPERVVEQLNQTVALLETTAADLRQVQPGDSDE